MTDDMANGDAMTGKEADAAIGIMPVAGHSPRRTDIDPRAAKRAERDVATMFGLSALMTVLFCVAFVKIPVEDVIRVPFFGTWSTSNMALGVTFGLAILFIGTGAIQWAKKLMNGQEFSAPRHQLATPPQSREQAIAEFNIGAEDSGFASRKIVRRSMLMAMSLFPIPLIVLLRDLGPLPGNSLNTTVWQPGMRVVLDVTGAPIRPSDIPIGGIVSAMPAVLPAIQEATGTQNARAKNVVILVRLEPSEILAQQGGTDAEPWDYQGILCFSKICTHVGCPIALYEQRTHHLLCPCHQSTFDLADAANVIFGPAARALPQLPITVDLDGYIVARDGFNQAVGPSFWERS